MTIWFYTDTYTIFRDDVYSICIPCELTQITPLVTLLPSSYVLVIFYVCVWEINCRKAIDVILYHKLIISTYYSAGTVIII